MTRSVAGFSLLEMLLVMALLAAASALAAATLGGGLERNRLRNASSEVAAQLRFTRAQAIATGQPQRFTIDPASRRWTAPNERSGELPQQLRVVFTGARELQPAAGEGAIVFFEDGASSGGRVRLDVAGARTDIDVAWLTGQVQVRRVAATAP